MIYYNPKNWFGLIFKFHKSDTFRQLALMMIVLGIYAAAIAYLEIDVMLLKYKTTTIMHSLLGVVIGLLMVFRTNTAYERWWEGRKLWGSLLNNARNTAIKLHAFLPANNAETRVRSKDLLSNFATALQYHLAGKLKDQEVEQPDIHHPNLIAKQLISLVNEAHQNNQLNGYQFLALNNELQSFTEITGACERIKKTPIPYSYSLFIKKFIFIYIMSMPFCFVGDFGYWVVLITVFVFYVLVSLELIAEEIEDPFGYDANDLPMTAISENVRKSTEEIFEL
jgi:putative membrane protein